METKSIYEAYADKEEMAIISARKIWTVKHPPPIRPKFRSNILKFAAGFVILVLAGMVVSGAHTIPLFRNSVKDGDIGGINVKDAVGIAAFTMIEVGMIMLAISRIVHYTAMQRETWEHNNRQVSKFIMVSLGLIFSVALFANVYSTIKEGLEDQSTETNAPDPVSMPMAGITTVSAAPAIASGESKGITLDTVVSLILFTLMGSAAPVVTVLSGEVIGKVMVSENAKKELADRKYEQDMEQWNGDFLDDYKARKGKGIWKVEVGDAELPLKIMPPEKPKLQAIYIDKERRQCPDCKKIMTKQSWTRHPCRKENE